MKFEFDYNIININIFYYNPFKQHCYFNMYVYLRIVYITGVVYMNAFSILLCLNASHVLAAVQNLNIYAFHNCSLNHHSCYV